MSSSPRDDQPIGVFDSGIGGLTVLRELHRRLPDEDFIYFGDTARVPYGTKSAETVTRFSRQIVEFLLEHNAHLIVVACNSASAMALDSLRRFYAVPFIGVIQPGAAQAAARTKTKRIGVIGTRATISSGAYDRALLSIDPTIAVFSQPCPLFVSLAEEGWTDHEATRLAAATYLRPLCDQAIDTLILGCTHYPLLSNVIQQQVGPEVTLVDSASSCAAGVANHLGTPGRPKRPSRCAVGRTAFYVSDMPEQLTALGERFLGERIAEVHVVDKC